MNRRGVLRRHNETLKGRKKTRLKRDFLLRTIDYGAGAAVKSQVYSTYP